MHAGVETNDALGRGAREDAREDAMRTTTMTRRARDRRAMDRWTTD
jgi:hypothetical protein